MDHSSRVNRKLQQKSYSEQKHYSDDVLHYGAAESATRSRTSRSASLLASRACQRGQGTTRRSERLSPANLDEPSMSFCVVLLVSVSMLWLEFPCLLHDSCSSRPDCAQRLKTPCFRHVWGEPLQTAFLDNTGVFSQCLCGSGSRSQRLLDCWDHRETPFHLCVSEAPQAELQ